MIKQLAPPKATREKRVEDPVPEAPGVPDPGGKTPPSYAGARRWSVIDIFFILIGLPAIFLIGAVLGLWIMIVSPGRLFFRQTRIGYKGQPFTIFKFRTMHQDSSTESHENHVAELMKSDAKLTKLDSKGDQRVIPGARILRNTGLDELPQLINVLRGEMSLVGPRPCLVKEYELYSPAQRERFDVLPGLTGWWQVNGKNTTTFAEMVAMDIHYARNRSIWMDMLIILRTPVVLLFQVLGRGSRVSEPSRTSVTRPIAETSPSVD